MHTYLTFFPMIIEFRIKFHSIFSHISQTSKKQVSKNKKQVAHDNMTPTKTRMVYRSFITNPILDGNESCHRKAPKCGKYAVQSTSLDAEIKRREIKKRKQQGNHGSATIEAVCIMPILLFAFLAFYSMGQIYILENQIYQATMNTASFLAEYAYLTELDYEAVDQEEQLGSVGQQLLGLGTATVRLRYYLEDRDRIDQYVVGGVNGLLITDPNILDKEGFINIKLQYWVRIPVPLLSNLSMPLSVQVRQKAYTGYREGNESVEERYVYIAEYSTVYHLSRSCTHLRLTIFPVTATGLETLYSGLDPCEYCGSEPSETYYVTATGDKYHTSDRCTGLKRTVRRVPFSEVNGYGPCSRCGGS